MCTFVSLEPGIDAETYAGNLGVFGDWNYQQTAV